MAGHGEWLPWRRDWSRYPNTWKVYVGYAVVAAVLGCFYLATGSLIGIAWLALAVVWTFATRYVRRRSRPGPSRGQSDHQPD